MIVMVIGKTSALDLDGIIWTRSAGIGQSQRQDFRGC